MSKKSREKIALWVFAALIVFGLIGVVWYMFAGHSWNVTASNIDESVGSMEGYTVVLYDGNMPETSSSTSSEQSNSQKSVTSQDSSSKTTDKQEQSKSSSNTNSISKNNSSTEKKNKSVSVEDVAKSYTEKGASILQLNVSNPSEYEEGTIIEQNQRKIGIITINVMLSESAQNLRLKPFREAGVDMIICITTVKSNMKNVSGVDLTICTADKTASVLGENKNNNFFVGTPEIGKVGAILISPSGVVSSKVIDEL